MRSWWWGIVGAVVAIVVVLSLSVMEYPALARLPGGTWLLVSADCPASVRAFMTIRASSALRRDVLIVPSDPGATVVRGWACGTLQEQLGEHGSWLRLLPADVVCEVVSREGALFRELNFIVSPAYAVDMVPSPVDWTPPGLSRDRIEVRR